jgi:rare lipoprotein A
MAPPALFHPFNAIRKLLPARHGEALITPFLAIAFLFAMVWDDFETSLSAAIRSIQIDAGAPSVVLSFTHAGSSAAGDSELAFLVDFDPDARTCELVSGAVMSPFAFAVTGDDLGNKFVTSRTHISALQPVSAKFTNLENTAESRFAASRKNVRSKFAAAYRSILKLAAVVGLPRIQEEAALSRMTIIGTISTYNPYRDGKEEGGFRTASGELYDPSAWTAAIQTGLRNQFGGVRFGRLYQPVYALIVTGEKRLIVKVNDVGPLRTGRVLDLNERSMRYFDPFLAQGLIQDVRITVLPGEDWTPGPVGEAYAINVPTSRAQQSAAVADEEVELANMRARLGLGPELDMKADARIEVRLTGRH